MKTVSYLINLNFECNKLNIDFEEVPLLLFNTKKVDNYLSVSLNDALYK